MKLHRLLRVLLLDLGDKSSHIVLAVTEERQRHILDVATDLHLLLLVFHLCLLQLHPLLLGFVVLKLARTLLGGIDPSEQAARNGLNRGHAWLAIGCQDGETGVKKATTCERLAFVVGSAGSWANEPIEK